MPYCYNCGNEIEEEDKFCKICDYPVTANFIGQTEVLQTKEVKEPRKINKFIYEIGNITKGMITSPIATIEQCSQELSNAASIFLAALMSVINGTYFVWVAKIIEGYFKTQIAKKQAVQMDGGIGNINYILSMLNFSYKKFFISGFIIYLLILITIFIIGYCIIKYLFKIKTKAYAIWKVCTCSLVPFIIGVFISIAFAYLSLKVAIIVITAALITTLMCLYSGIKEETQLKDDKILVCVLIQTAAIIIATNMYVNNILNTWINTITINSFIQSIFNVLIGSGI